MVIGVYFAILFLININHACRGPMCYIAFSHLCEVFRALPNTEGVRNLCDGGVDVSSHNVTACAAGA